MGRGSRYAGWLSKENTTACISVSFSMCDGTEGRSTRFSLKRNISCQHIALHVQTWMIQEQSEPPAVNTCLIVVHFIPLEITLPALPATSATRFLFLFPSAWCSDSQRRKFITRGIWSLVVTTVQKKETLKRKKKKVSTGFSSMICWSPFTRYLCKWLTSVINYDCVTKLVCLWSMRVGGAFQRGKRVSQATSATWG